MDWAVWARDKAPTCPSCRGVYGLKNPPEEPPCETCRVELLDENRDAAKIYQITRGQVVAVGEHVIDIDQAALWQAIDHYGIPDPVRCFELVNTAFHHTLKKE